MNPFPSIVRCFSLFFSWNCEGWNIRWSFLATLSRLFSQKRQSRQLRRWYCCGTNSRENDERNEETVYCVTRAPLLLLRSWVALLSKSLSEWGIGDIWPDVHVLSLRWPNAIKINQGRPVLTVTVPIPQWLSTTKHQPLLSFTDPVNSNITS